MKIFELLTDSKDRPAIEALMGLIFLTASLVHAFMFHDVAMFGAISAVGTTLIVTYSVGNNQLDKGQ